MKRAWENRFSQGKVGESVAIKISDVDRARSDSFVILLGFYCQVFLQNIIILLCLF